LNNNNFNPNNDAKDDNTMKSQQFFFPGGPQGEPNMPGMGEQPRTAPPNFIPEAPGMDSRTFGGPDGGTSFRDRDGDRGRGRGDFMVRPRELNRCLNRFTFIWLENGNSFWFYPTFVGRQFVQGFRWRRNRWEFERINLRRIFFFRCF
jgi:hypothetical protein